MVVGDTGSSSSSSLPKLCDERLRASRVRRSCSAVNRLRPPAPYRLSESSVASSSGATTAVLLLLFRKRLVYLKESNVSYKKERWRGGGGGGRERSKEAHLHTQRTV